MLAPKSTRERLAEEHDRFRTAYEQVLGEAGKIMRQRGEVRDVDTPIFYRRPPDESLGLAKNKILRAQSIHKKIDELGPDRVLVEDLLEECVDSMNYLAFVSALCVMILEEEEIK